jgi:hypothetical protein
MKSAISRSPDSNLGVGYTNSVLVMYILKHSRLLPCKKLSQLCIFPVLYLYIHRDFFLQNLFKITRRNLLVGETVLPV